MISRDSVKFEGVVLVYVDIFFPTVCLTGTLQFYFPFKKTVHYFVYNLICYIVQQINV